MKRFSYAVALLLPLLAACSGGGSSTPAAVPQAVIAPLGTLSEAQSDAQAIVSQPLSSSGSNDLLYVGNTGNNSITVYRHDASGNTAPMYVISGPNTGISGPGQLSEDAQGNLYVANGQSQSTNAAILVFAHGANGNVAPIRRLAGPLTGIHYVEAMTVDKVTGKIFVFDSVPDLEGASSLLRFPPNATGNEAPFARSGPSFQPAVQMASDSTGQNIIEAHGAECCNSNNVGVTTAPKQFANNSDPPWLYSVDIFSTSGVADDPTTKTYLASGTGGNVSGIYRFAENTTGQFPYRGGPNTLQPAVVSVITSDICSSQLAVAPGPTPYTYATHSTQFGRCSTDAVYVYRNNASGNATPVRVLSGSATGLNAPYGIYEGH